MKKIKSKLIKKIKSLEKKKKTKSLSMKKSKSFNTKKKIKSVKKKRSRKKLKHTFYDGMEKKMNLPKEKKYNIVFGGVGEYSIDELKKRWHDWKSDDNIIFIDEIIHFIYEDGVLYNEDRYFFIKGDFNKETTYKYIENNTIDSMIFDFSTIKFCDWDNKFISKNIIPKLSLNGILYCDFGYNLFSRVLVKDVSKQATFKQLCESLKKTIDIKKKETSDVFYYKLYKKNNIIKDIFFLHKIDDTVKEVINTLITNIFFKYKLSKQQIKRFENEVKDLNEQEKINLLEYWRYEKIEIETEYNIFSCFKNKDFDKYDKFQMLDTELVDVIDVFKPDPEAKDCVKISLITNLLMVPPPKDKSPDISSYEYNYLKITKVSYENCKKFTDGEGGIYL